MRLATPAAMFLSTPTLEVATSSFIALELGPSSLSSSFDGIISVSEGNSQLQRWSSLIGIVTAIVGNILISFALNIQRYAHIRLNDQRIQRREKAKASPTDSRNGYGTMGLNGNLVEEQQNGNTCPDDHLSRSFNSLDSQSTQCSDDDHKQDSTYLQSPYWWGGIILMTIGEAGNFLAYGFAPASIVSPLGVVALISNCVIAPIMLKEQFRFRDFWGVVVAVAGAVTVVLSAKNQEKKLGPHEILGAITTMEFEIYMGITVLLIGLLMWASPRFGNRTILIDLGLVGLFGGYTALSTKGVASMLSSTMLRALTTPVTYMLLAILIGTAVMQVRYVNKALQRFDSTQVIPVQFVMFTLSVIIGSAVLYRDFEKATAENVGKFTGGCLLTFFGVWLITSGRPQHGEDDEEEFEEDEERINLADQEPSGEQSYSREVMPQHPSIRRRSKAESQNGIAVQDDDGRGSRRSSRVSFADPASRPQVPRMYSNSSNQPSQAVPPTSSDLESCLENTPLLNNPWNALPDDLKAARHPGMAKTTSSPFLPSEAQTPSTESLLPPPTGRSSTQENLHTHPNDQHSLTPPQADRPYTPRHSISRMMPGPLSSPLSGGLSAVVADSLRRGVESPLRKRSRLRIQRTKSGSQRLSHASENTDDDDGTSPLKQINTAEESSKPSGAERSTEWSRITRARSLSNTLGELFRGKRQKTASPELGRDEELCFD